MKTGINFILCKVLTAVIHNLRDKDYIKAVNASPNKKYSIFGDKTKTNVSWVNPAYEEKTLPELLDELRNIYREKVGQAPQEDDRVREITDKKTGMKRTVTTAGWSPIREGVCPIKPDTTVDDFKPFIKWLKTKGLQVVRLDLHHDEGYTDPVTGKRKYNHHAHVIVDWVDHSTGKTRKLSKADTREMQTQLAAALDMERGVSKTETGADHLTPDEQRAKAAAAEIKRLQEEIDKLKKSKQDVEASAERSAADLITIESNVDATRKELDNIEADKRKEKTALEGIVAAKAHALDELQKIQVTARDTDQQLQRIQEETDAANKELEEIHDKALKEGQILTQTIASNQEAQKKLKESLNALKLKNSAIAMYRFILKLWDDMIEQLENALNWDGWAGSLTGLNHTTRDGEVYTTFQMDRHEGEDPVYTLDISPTTGKTYVDSIETELIAENTAAVLRQEFTPEAHRLLASCFLTPARKQEEEEQQDQTEHRSQGRGL